MRGIIWREMRRHVVGLVIVAIAAGIIAGLAASAHRTQTPMYRLLPSQMSVLR